MSRTSLLKKAFVFEESMDYYISQGSDLGCNGKVKHLQSQMNAGSRKGNGGVNRSSLPIGA